MKRKSNAISLSITFPLWIKRFSAWLVYTRTQVQIVWSIYCNSGIKAADHMCMKYRRWHFLYAFVKFIKRISIKGQYYSTKKNVSDLVCRNWNFWIWFLFYRLQTESLVLPLPPSNPGSSRENIMSAVALMRRNRLPKVSWKVNLPLLYLQE